MKSIFLFAGAAALLVAAPTLAKPGNGHGNGNGNGNGYGHEMEVGQSPYGHGNGHGHQKHASQSPYGYGVGGCPPGLAKKNNGCLPPGQAKKLYSVGQRFSTTTSRRWNYNQIPYSMRQQYGLTQSDRYYYRNGYVYQVDPKTMLVQQVLSALIR